MSYTDRRAISNINGHLKINIMKKTILLLAGLAFFVTKINSQTVTDYDGNIYNTVTIGTQVWLKENLKVTHYRNGDSIPNVLDETDWSNLTTGAYCDYDNSKDTSSKYGRLYNWYAVVDSRNICPIGWHIPTDSNMSTLETYLGGINVTGGKLKETGYSHWESPNTGATNSTGFTAFAGGYRESYGLFTYFRITGNWWSSTEFSSSNAWFRSMGNSYEAVARAEVNKKDGLSLRCLRDTPTQINGIYNQEKIEIYPNPAIDKIYINSSTRQNLKMQVFNTVGQCVLQRELNNKTNSIDISSLTNGIYILKLTSPNGTIERKIIKE
jgi:uncharacterized protein (TIGR02145 family)